MRIQPTYRFQPIKLSMKRENEEKEKKIREINNSWSTDRSIERKFMMRYRPTIDVSQNDIESYIEKRETRVVSILRCTTIRVLYLFSSSSFFDTF